jgi:hypothetical protein
MKNKNIILAIVMLGAGLLAGTIIGAKSSVFADTSEPVDSVTLDLLYSAVFHRPADIAGKNFHLGRDIKLVLRDFNNSPESTYYGALYESVKAYEEAQRAPGTLSDSEKQSYLDLIDSAMSNLVAWVGTLPDQDPCNATIGPLQARTAVQNAYDQLASAGKTSAEFGLLNASRRIGPPSSISVFSKCAVTPTPSPSTAATVSPTPSVTPTPTPTLSITPTPTLTPTPTGY